MPDSATAMVIAPWAIDFSSGIPAYRQIVNLLFAEIGAGRFREGDRLPTIRETADQLGVNPNTVAKAFRELELRGVIEGRRGDGSFVADRPVRPSRLSASARRAKLDELLGRVVAEARVYGIPEAEILQHAVRRLREDD